jgi:Recombination endonuclease VII
MTDLAGHSEPTKICRICKVAKPLSDSYRATGARDGHRNDCKSCNLTARVGRYRANPRPAIEREQRWRRDNPERYRERMREYQESGKKAIADRKSHLKRQYGLMLEQYDAMLEGQGGVCAICQQPRPEERTLHVDHDHSTGAIRGLLCFSCNNALGDLRESHELFHAAAEYLEADIELNSRARDRALSLRS